MRATLLKVIALTAVVCSAGVLNADIVDNSGGGFAIPDNNATGMTSSIVIAANETITDVDVTLFNTSHTWVGDLTVRLTSPNLTTADIMVRTGGGFGDSTNIDADYTFSDGGDDWWNAADIRSDSEVIPGGTYAATTTGGGAVSLAALFSGESTAGTWTLFVSDESPDDTGTLGGWGLTITSNAIPEPASLTFLGLFGVACLARRRR